MRKLARYGPLDRYNSPPAAGMCISVFALLRKGGRLLVGVPKDNERWNSEWLPSNRKDTDEPEKSGLWRLPSAYLLEGEHPENALGRVMRGQLAMDTFAYSGPRVYSYAELSEWYPGNKHWDLAFAYEVRIGQATLRHPQWKELAFLGISELGKRDFGWNNDFVREVVGVKPQARRGVRHPKT